MSVFLLCGSPLPRPCWNCIFSSSGSCLALIYPQCLKRSVQLHYCPIDSINTYALIYTKSFISIENPTFLSMMFPEKSQATLCAANSCVCERGDVSFCLYTPEPWKGKPWGSYTVYFSSASTFHTKQLDLVNECVSQMFLWRQTCPLKHSSVIPWPLTNTSNTQTCPSV